MREKWRDISCSLAEIPGVWNKLDGGEARALCWPALPGSGAEGSPPDSVHPELISCGGPCLG